jgi:rhamnosyltransferase subunit B
VHASVAALLRETQRVRTLAGLPERPASPESVQPALSICLWPSWFSSPQKDWPRDTRVAGFPFYPKPPVGRRPPAEEDPARSARPIVFMRGSAASHQTPFFSEAIRCCALLGRPGVLLTPHAGIPAPLPPGVSHVAFAPLGELFGRAAAVVHHGGIGTMAYAFAAGIPQIVVPIVGDQFDLGYRMERLGVGSMVTQDPPSARRLARELDRLCSSPRVRRRCEELSNQVDPDAGCRLSADWIEELVASRFGVAAGRGRLLSASGFRAESDRAGVHPEAVQ